MSTPTTTAATPVGRARARYALFGSIGAGALAGALIALALTTTAAVPGIVEPSTAVVVGLPLARAVLDLAALTTVGMSLLPTFVGFDRPERTASATAAARRIAMLASLMWLAAALASLVFQTANFNPGRPVTMASIVAYVKLIGAGQALLIVAGSALLYLVIGIVAVRPDETVPAKLRITVSMFALLPLPATGHAANSTTGWRYLTMIAMELHVLGAVLWTGGLLAVIIAVAANRALLADALPKYSKLATACVFLTACTGAFNGWFELHLAPGLHWYVALFATGYGRILIGKIICVAVAGLLGAHVRFRLLPAIRARKATAVASWATMEVLVMGVAFGLAAVLIQAPMVSS
jgi:putative copper resistance protein D